MPTIAKDFTVRFQNSVADILRNSSAYHDAYYMEDTFRGPSLHFHRRSIAMIGEPLTVQRLECVYATLVSWGMHRMGKGGSKMRPFEEFRESILACAVDVAKATTINLASIGDGDWQCLKNLFMNIRVMKSDTMLVGNSKVMAHLVPAIVPPIDREYTLRHLLGNKTIRNNPEHVWSLLKTLMESFFLPVVQDSGFRLRAQNWVSNQERYPWDTSLMKVVDNLLIGARKKQAGQEE
jgi:hypothetical protein